MIQHQFRNDERLQGLEQGSAEQARFLEPRDVRGLLEPDESRVGPVNRAKQRAAELKAFSDYAGITHEPTLILSTPCVADHTPYGRNKVVHCSSATALLPALFSHLRTPLLLLDYVRDGQYLRFVGVMLRVVWSTSCIPHRG